MPKGVRGFQPGVSGNPNGRPKKTKAIADLLRMIGKEKTKDAKGRRVYKIEKVMRMVYDYAMDGDRWAIGFIADRTEGRPNQTIEENTTITRTTINPEVLNLSLKTRKELLKAFKESQDNAYLLEEA